MRPDNFSGEVLLRTRRRLGVSEVVAGGMHLDVYQAAIQVRATCGSCVHVRTID